VQSEKNIVKSKRRRLLKAFVWIAIILLTNIVGFTLTLQSTTVQTRLVQYLSDRFSAATGFAITLKHIDIDWLDKATIQGLMILDDHDNIMIEVPEVTIDYKLSTLFRKSDVLIDELILLEPHIELITYADSLLNITKFINSIKEITKTKKGNNSIFTIDHIKLTNGEITFNTLYKDSIKNQFDYNHFKLTDLGTNINYFSIRHDTISMAIRQLQATDSKSQLVVKELTTDFEVSQSRMLFDNLLLKAGNSVVKDSIVFSYRGMNNLNHFNDSVRIIGNLDQVILASEDLAIFVPYFKTITENYRLSGIFRGKVTNFNVADFRIGFGKGSFLSGQCYINGLPDIDETFMDIRLNSSVIFENDLNQYVTNESFSEYNRFDNLHLDGNFTGYIQDFVATGKFYTNLGYIQTDINLKVAENPANTAYKGSIKLGNFALGTYLDLSRVGQLSLEGHIAGRGVNLSNADFTLVGEASQFEFNGYSYTNIKVNAQFASEFFEGSISVNDPNFKLTSDSFIDLRESRDELRINGELEIMNFKPLNLIEHESFLSTKINMNTRGFNIDSIVGHIYLEDLKASYQGQDLEVARLLLNSEKKDELRTLELITDRVDLKIDGNFNFTTAVNDITRLLYEYRLNLRNESDSLAAYYANVDLNHRSDYQININGHLRDVNKLINLFFPEFYFSNNTRLTGHFRHGHSAILGFNLVSDTIKYAGNTFLNNELNFHTSKIADNQEVLAVMDFVSDEQIIGNGTATDEFIASAVWDNHKIDFNLFLEQQDYNNVADLYGEITFLKDTTNLTFLPSNIRVLDKIWAFQQDNKTSFSNQEIHVSNLSVFNETEELKADGIVSRNPGQKLTLAATDLKLGMINPLINKELSGIINGKISVANVYDNPVIESDFIIQDLSINNFAVGSVKSFSLWNHNTNLFDVNFYIEKDSLRALNLTGTFNPFDNKNSLNLTTQLKNADLSVAEPFIATIFSEITGKISGEFSIGGTVRHPYLFGNGEVSNAQMKVNYLNTLYRLQGQWSLDSSAIRLNNVRITDINNKTATMTGVFKHNGFRDFNMELNGLLNEFQVLNTTAKDNDLFYGTGIATGELNISGPFNNILISAKAKTNKGTKFYIPVGGSSATRSDEYITFVNFADTVNDMALSDVEKQVRLTGIAMNFDLEITPDAYAEIIFDQTVGDIIRGTGQGNISMEIDTKGEFTMVGEYEFIKGGYNFTMYNIVNKEFTIEPKSKIVWSGDPYSGDLDIDATYEVVTSLAPLIDTIYHDLPDVKRNYPSKVKLNLQGPLLNPDITFVVLIEDYPKSNVDLDTQVRAFLSKIETDEQELNRQVFSLLVLRKYSPPNAFATGGTLGSSVSEFISNQLSYWISQVDDNLTIDIDLGQLDENALNTFQLRVSYTFLDGDLIVTRDGGFTDAYNQTTIASIAGDWTVEYLLSEDGKLRVKLFKKTNYNQLNSALDNPNQSLITGGFSIIYTTSFNRLRDIFNGKKKKKGGDGDGNNLNNTSAIIKTDEDQPGNEPEIR
jgi:hypothetical protein